MSKLTLGAAACSLTLFPILVLGQGGAPFRSDDPDTPGNKHWEINLGFIGERNPFEGSYDTPSIDINFGVGNRVQLKYEAPLSIQETRDDSGKSHIAAGPGNSLVGLKYRFFQRHSKHRVQEGERVVKFSASIYPQLLVNNPTRSVARDIAEPGPQLLLPMEANANYGWIRVSGELGYWLTSKDVPNSWMSGLVVGHEFRPDAELYAELFTQRNVLVSAGADKLRDTTISLGGRLPIVKGHWLRLIGMAGHGLGRATPSNGQPTWIAYIGMQFLSDRRRRHGDE